jgi:aminoglycoside N3'-acetyltransferase
MSEYVSRNLLLTGLAALGIRSGDTVLIRASLRAIGRVRPSDFVEALIEAVGESGTIVSLAFTHGSWLRSPRLEDAYTRDSPTYGGVLPTAMLRRKDAVRSAHPLASYVAIGRDAAAIVANHGPSSGSYDPVRAIIERRGKNVLVGCVASNPGFTTVHVAEADLGHLRRVVMPWLTSKYYYDEAGRPVLFRYRDPGVGCSKSFWKFYGHYVRAGLLTAGHVGDAYSISAPALECYALERQILALDPRFNTCGSPDCFMCNGGRWDRIHRLPLFVGRRLLQRTGLVRRAVPAATPR